MPSFKVDENLPIEIASTLRAHGYDAVTVHDQRMIGGPDLRLAEVCRRENRVLVTLDLDFADIRTYPPQEFAGFIVLRPALQDKPHVLTMFSGVLTMLQRESASNQLWIVDETHVRIRGDIVDVDNTSSK